MQEAGGVAADRVDDLPYVVERNATRAAAVVNACGKFVLQDVLHCAAKVRARERVAEFVRKQGRWATGAEPIRYPVNRAGASAGRVVHRERHTENHGVRLDGADGIFGFGLVFAVIVNWVFRVGLDVGAVRLCLFVAAKDHVGRDADERGVVAGGECGGIDALTVVQEPAPGRVTFASLECAVSACVNDGPEMETLEKLAQAFCFFSVDSENVVTKNARVFDRPYADNTGNTLRGRGGRCGI